MHLQKIGLLFLPVFAFGVSTSVPVNLPALLTTPKALAQAPNDPKLDQNPTANSAVRGSFVDYFAEEAQLKGHEGSVNSASFSSDGKLIVTAGTDGTARVWDTSGKLVGELRGHSASVRSASFSPDGKRIVTASFDGTARVWDLSGKQLVELTGHQGNVYSASFSPDGGRIVTAGADNTVRVWDASGKLLVEIKGHSGSVYSASFSPDGKRIVTASADKTARVWDLSGKLLAELTGHTDTVWSASFSPDGQRIVTASDDKTARVWDLSGKQLAELIGHKDSVYSASFSPDSKQIVTASVDGIALMWDVSGNWLAKLQRHDGGVNSASFSPDGKWILTASVDSTARVWDTSSKLFTELGPISSFGLVPPSFSPDGKLIVSASSDNTFRVWNNSGKLLAQLTGHQIGLFDSASFSPDGKLIVTTSGDNIVRVWDTSGKLLAQLKGHQKIVNSASFSPNGKLIVTASWDNTARVWDTSGKLLAELKGHQDSVYSASFSPDGKRIVTASRDKTARVWDTSGKLLAELKGHQYGVNSASFSPNSKLILTASGDSAARIWDTSGNLLVELPHSASPSFSPDGQRIVTVVGYGLRVWDTSGNLLAESKIHRCASVSASFSPDGKLIVTASADTRTNESIACVWDTSGKLLAELKGHTQVIESINFSPDGKRMVTTVRGDNPRVWYLSDKLLAQFRSPETPTAATSEPYQRPYSGEYTANFSPDGKLIVTTEDIARLWDTSGKLLAELEGQQGSVNSASFSPDGKRIVIASNDNTASVWDTSGQFLVELRHKDRVQSASFSPNSKLIVTGSKDGIVSVWDTFGKLVAEFKGHEYGINSASFSPDGKLIVTTGYTHKEATARVWDISGKLLAEIKGHQGSVESASFSPDGKLIVTTSWDKTARVWNINGKLVAELIGHNGEIYDASFSPDSKLIVTASWDKTARVWDINGNQLVVFKGHQSEVKSASFSPDGKQILTVSDSIRVWDINGNLISEKTLDPGKLMQAALEDIKQIGERFKQIAFQGNGGSSSDFNTFISPDGQIVFTFTASASSSSGTLVFFWDSSSQQLAQVKVPLSNVKSASLSSDRKRILTISYDGTARVWDLSGKQLATLELPAPPSSAKVEANRLRNLEFYAPNCAAAFEPWQKALKIYQEIADNENESLMLHKLGYAYHCLSNYTNAINFYSQALTIAQKYNYLGRQAETNLNLGIIYYTLVDYEKAIKYFDDALELLQKQDSQLKALVLHNRANIYFSQGKYNEAIQDYLKASTIYEKVKYASGFAQIKINLASIYQSLGDYNKAIQYYKESIELSPIEALAGLGHTYLALGDTAKAIDLHQQSLEKARQQENKEGEANALNNLAYTLRQAGKFAEAEQYLCEAIEIWENLRINLDDTNKVSIFEKQTQTYLLLQEVLIAQNKPEEALEIAERGRSRAFVELLASRISPNPNEQPSITPPNSDRIKQIAKAQNATLVEYSIISDTFNVQGKEQTKESELYIWVIKPTGEITFRRSDLKPLWQCKGDAGVAPTTLADLVTSSRETIGVRSLAAIERPDAPQVQDQLKRLHELLIKPISDLLPTQESDKVIFIPQSSLFLVPFPALQDENDKYLIEKHTILTAPSIQVLELTRQQRQQLGTQGKNALVVGNPTMPKVALTIGEPPQQLSPLPGAEAEAKAIAPLLNTQALIGNQATEAAILPLLPSARIIHLATHGILDDIQGLKSAIALAPSSMAPPLTKGGTGGVEEGDGLLTAEELLNLKLNAELVVLSACDTGRGKITGDGVIGLSRSFISAGVPSVIVSLWAVPDAPTAFLMTEFYNNLQKNPDKAQALRQAMLTTLKQHPNPKNWAAFTLIGESH